MKATYSMDDSAGEEVYTDIAVSSLDPAYGVLSGGTSVTVNGHGFIGDVSVSFGNMALDITVLDAETIVFSTPSSPSEGKVDVHVESDLGSITLEEGFNYTNSAPEPSTEPSNEPTNEPTNEPDTGGNSSGLTGGMVEMWRKLYTCPDCFGLSQNAAHTIEASAAIHSPMQGSWYSWFPPVNSCINQINQASLSTSQQFSSISLTGPGSIGLSYDGSSGTYLNANVNSGSWAYGSHYSLQTSDFTIQNALRTPDDSFTSLEPANAFAAEGFLQGFSKSNFTILWEPYGTTDYVLFLLEVFDSATGAAHYTLCLIEDSGGFTLDYSLLATLPTYEAAAIHLYRLQAIQSVHPQNNSAIEGVSAVGIIGTGYLTE